jgi:hypothetical protein
MRTVQVEGVDIEQFHLCVRAQRPESQSQGRAWRSGHWLIKYIFFYSVPDTPGSLSLIICFNIHNIYVYIDEEEKIPAFLLSKTSSELFRKITVQPLALKPAVGREKKTVTVLYQINSKQPQQQRKK